MNKWMQKALELASLAQGDTAPNPMVGSVLVCGGNILSAGYHKGPGEWHAEREALLKLGQNRFPEMQCSTLILNRVVLMDEHLLVRIIIEKGIKKVVVGMLDPDPRMAGKGSRSCNKLVLKSK